jgi:adenylate kinase family enzyme
MHMLTEQDHSDNLQCTHCYAVMPPYALFCGACGKSFDANNSELPPADDTSGTVGAVSASELGVSLAEILEVTTEDEEHLINDPEEDTIPRLASTQLSGVNPHISDSLIFTRLPWLWQVIIILSAIATVLVTFVFPETPLRPIIVMWFLLFCPGMMLVRFLRLNQLVVEWMLALALSLSIDAIVSGVVLYTGLWSPAAILTIIMCLTLVGAITQLAMLNLKSSRWGYPPWLREQKYAFMTLPMGNEEKVGCISETYNDEPMIRIHIVGPPASGKTTLAQKLATNLKIPFYELDYIAWQEGIPKTERSLEDRLEDIRSIAAQPVWVTEGIFLIWTDELLHRATYIVWLDMPLRLVLKRIVIRRLRWYLTGMHLPSSFLKQLQFLKHIGLYYFDTRRVDTRIFTANRLMIYKKKLIHCRHPSEVEAFFKSIPIQEQGNKDEDNC